MFAALHVPDFPVAAALRNHRNARDLPCAVLAAEVEDDAKGKLPIATVNRAARFGGVHPGWPLNRALVRCPGLRVLPRDPQAEDGLTGELIELGETLTPDLELTAPDMATLDLSGLRFPLEDLFSAAILPEVELWTALAETPDLAGLAARCESTRGRVVRPEDLANSPLSVLRLLAAGDSALSLLELWGLQTLGGFMALPRQALIERLGPQAGRWHDLLHGKTCRLLRLHRPPESLAQRLHFEDALVSLEPLVFSIKRLLHTLTGRLASRHLAACELQLRLFLESGGEVMRSIRLPEPRNTIEGMLGPLQVWLDSLRIDAPVAALELDARATFATAAQREWFGRQLPQPERWAETLARLEGLLGQGRVGVPVPPETHQPDAFSLRPALGAVVSDRTREPFPACPLPLQRYRPPLNIAVAHEPGDPHPRPLALLTGPHPGRVTGARGPYPASGHWWEPSTVWQRLEWDIQLADRSLLRLVLQPPDHWQLDGIYR